MNIFGKNMNLPNWLILLVNFTIGLALLWVFILYINHSTGTCNLFFPHYKGKVSENLSDQINEEKATIGKQIANLETKLKALIPAGAYMVINTTENQFFIYKKEELLYQGFCSTGSSTLLESDNDRQWLFQTPKGVFPIRGKKTDPLWKKPDWAFVEEGLPIPSPNHPSRFEYGVLGDYALSIGNGYLIHGTLFQRFIGLPVTHGCVRLNDEDLKFVYSNLNIGSKVFIY
jgi:L,D-transpeptidase ErfK/SrfK